MIHFSENCLVNHETSAAPDTKSDKISTSMLFSAPVLQEGELTTVSGLKSKRVEYILFFNCV